MKRRRWVAWVFAFAGVSLGTGAGTACAAEAPATALRCGRLIDTKAGRVEANAIVLVRGDRIVEVGAHVAVPPDAKLIDLSAYTVLPGLIDAHTHVLLQPEDEHGPPPVLMKSQAFRTIQGVAAARKDLEAGFTTLRDVDSEGAGFADVALRDAIEKGIVPGPRLLVSTYAISITAGHMNNHGLNPDIFVPEPATLADSREAMIAEVRRQVKYGADWIKLYATGTLRHVDPETLEPLSQVSLEDVRAVVAEAARWRRDVAAHAYGGEGARNSVRGGVRSIEHGMLLDDETLKLMLDHGTFYCPTLSTYFPSSPEEDTPLRRRIIARHKQSFQKALKLGVKITFGTDVGAFEHGAGGVREFPLMVDYGMAPMDALRSATLRAAELLRMEDRLGSIEPGKLADVVALEGNPLDDIKAVGRVVFVMKAGQVYRSTR